MRVLFFWEPVGGLTLQHRCNPYAGLLARSLEKLDVYLELGDYAFERDWLAEKRKTCEVLHLNWLHPFYRADDLDATVERFAQFDDNLEYARRIGYRIVWTLHNLYPHERPFPDIDHLGRLLVARLANACIAHCEYAAASARRRFFYTGDTYVIPHGHFIDVFPNSVGRAEARARLGVPDKAFAYVFFGNARGYKSVESLIDAFTAVGDDDAVLILMMRHSFDPEYAQEIRNRADGDERIRVFTSDYFPESDFQYYLNSADVAVLPFSEVLTSGSAITALSFGTPVILPRRGCLPTLVDDSMGILYDPSSPGGLQQALRQIRKRDLAAAGGAALTRARQLDWDGIAARVAEVYCGRQRLD